MKSTAQIHPGICGFESTVAADCQDGQHVVLRITSACENVQRAAAIIEQHGPIDSYREVGNGITGVVLSASRKASEGCCSACAVPIGIFKCLQVAAGLALPKDIHITLTKEVAQ